MPERSPGTPRHIRRLAFGVLVAASVALAAGYVTRAALDARSSTGGTEATARISVPVRADGARVAFRSLDRKHGRMYGRVAVARFAKSVAKRTLTGLTCDRVHVGAGRGLCLTRRGRLFTYRAVIFRRDFRHGTDVNLNGIPSRARVSPDGRYGAATTFVSGHSYAVVGAFSTATVLIDMRRGTKLGNLEEFTVTRDGRRFRKRDFNFWGVTFARESNRFYATLASGEKTYLVEGNVRSRTARVLRENVECPSLSPDNTRLAYKKLVRRPGGWRFHVLDLATMSDTPLAEDRHIDDQVEWLDNRRILYRAGEDVWTVRADGSGSPQRFLRAADSPAVVRVAS
jgi:hypothetical protein